MIIYESENLFDVVSCMDATWSHWTDLNILYFFASFLLLALLPLPPRPPVGISRILLAHGRGNATVTEKCLRAAVLLSTSNDENVRLFGDATMGAG